MEGPTDAAVIRACAERLDINLGAMGIVIVDAEGKHNLAFCHAILTALNVRCHTVFDGDAHETKDEARRKNAKDNLNLLAYLGGPRETQPETDSLPGYTVFAENLERYLQSWWPAWPERMKEMINAGEGCGGKDVPTYREATRTAATNPPDLLHALLENVRALVA